MKRSLVIVESPAKSRTLTKILGEGFEVVSSMGHLIDLPANGMGIDIDNNFKPNYIVIPSRKKILTQLKNKAKDKSIIYLATDPDREGEAISWHLWRELSDSNKRSLRVEFHEITKNAIETAFKNPRHIDMNKVNAQQARRILDRIVGYSLSPLLWEKVGRGLSAGRVQSVALWLIVDRENKINSFTPEEYWEIEAELKRHKGPSSEFTAKLNQVEAKKPQIRTKDEAERLVDILKDKNYIVIALKEQKKAKFPPSPYTTSKMQQEAFNRLHFSASKTMRIAQQLYEGLELGSEGSSGLITYMRTDSIKVSQEAQEETKGYIEKNFGKEYIPERVHRYRTKQKTQEAHEAIRPTSVNRTPSDIKRYLTQDQHKLYELIWKRFLQSQMSSALIKVKVVDISAKDSKQDYDRYIFRATGSEIVFDGFLKLDMGIEQDSETTANIPVLEIGEILNLIRLIPSQHFTKPPPRYSEASLVKELEERGIGRPSTYAPIIATLGERHYVEIKSGYFYPTELGIVVTELLVKYFPNILNVTFTAKMETELDRVEEGSMDWIKALKDFYSPFIKSLSHAQAKMEDVKKRQIKTEYKCELCGKPMVFRWSKRGTFLGCSGFPKCKNTKLAKKTRDGNIELIEVEIPNRVCDKCQKPMVVRYSSLGRFLSCSGYPNCKNAKPFPTGVKCPQPHCTGELVERYSRRGLFYGCSKYPGCKYTVRKLPEE